VTLANRCASDAMGPSVSAIRSLGSITEYLQESTGSLAVKMAVASKSCKAYQGSPIYIVRSPTTSELAGDLIQWRCGEFMR
jgi:hypothetical protein